MHLTVRRRALIAGTICAALTGIALPARADSTPGVSQAQQNLAQAQSKAQQAGTALGAAQQQLAGAQQQLAAVQARVAALDLTVTTDTARMATLDQQVRDDKTSLATYVRSIYKSGGSEGAIAYIIASGNLGDAFARVAELDRVNQAGKILLKRIAGAQAAAKQALADATTARQQAELASQQAATAEAVVAVEEQQLETVASVARQAVHTAQRQLSAAQQAAAQLAAAQAAAAAAAAAAQQAAQSNGTVYHPVSGPTFTIDTDLTRPSGETAARLDGFLSGTALAGLGSSFTAAERTYHVSARYFVAHAILESAWGTSAIAHDKHNLFGYGADDANPYVDARTFASFDACIQYVAAKVAGNYLSPSGAFYHGPTLRGMNVDYASDPLWASSIARIANTIPD
ncbi:MAG TPA: glucosaminidase domain-containing protein [Candidatus Dormibacteraeota bacterium]